MVATKVRLVSVQGAKISGQRANIGVVQLLCERRHLPLDAVRDELVDELVALMDVVQVRARSAAREEGRESALQ